MAYRTSSQAQVGHRPPGRDDPSVAPAAPIPLRARFSGRANGQIALDLPDADSIAQARPLHGLNLALIVFAAYYLGTRAGLALTFLPNPISVAWPPNAILFALLLLTPRAKWWIVMVAALPAHLLAELQGGVPLEMVLCWFVSNVCEALIGALCVQHFAGGTVSFDKRRDVLAFLAAAALATIVSSFLDSAFVIFNRWGERGYWDLWRTRLFSNTTASLVIVPLIVAWMGRRVPSLRLGSRLRIVEAIALAIGLIAATVLVFDVDVDVDLPLSPIWTYLPLPFLLWAALRFGPAGTTTAIAVVACIVTWGAGHGIGALGTGSPTHDARSVQLFLLFVAPTLLFLAATLEERRAVERELRTSDSRFQLVLEATSDSVYDHEMASGRMWWSGKSLESLGYAMSERPATFDGWLALVHPDDRGRISMQVSAALAAGEPRWEAQFRVRARDGSYAHMHEQGFVVRDAAGAPAQLIAALADVTERHDLEELNQRLTHAARLTAMGELTASIAHEINQPMSAILSNVDAAEMLLDAGEYKDGDLREILDDIRSDDIRASEIIRHIRSLAKKRETDMQIFSVRDLIEGVLRLVGPLAQRRRVQLSADLGGQLGVYADRIHVQQIMLNLLFNAMDSMDGVPQDQRAIRVSTRARGDGYMEIAVRDHGHGIAAARIDKVFDSFFTTKKDGIGLGLSIARSLVEAHGGSIWASNNEDAGATFTFTLASRPVPAA